jgi:hypothetical protein
MTEREHLEAIAVKHDEQADDIYGDVNHQLTTGSGIDRDERDERVREADAHRRAAEIIRYQLECEA